jgi:hypothetical protein
MKTLYNLLKTSYPKESYEKWEQDYEQVNEEVTRGIWWAYLFIHL